MLGTSRGPPVAAPNTRHRRRVGFRATATTSTVSPMNKVLLIADSEWVKNDVVGALDTPRRRIVALSDPRLVVEEAIAQSPQTYIVDMQVGSMGGMAIVRAIKDGIGAGTIPASPIVVLLDRSADQFLAQRAGADAWVLQPFSAQELRAAVGGREPVGA